MALKYRKVQRKVQWGPDEGKVRTYAVPRSGLCDMELLSEMVSARSAMSSADIKAILDSLNWVMRLQLQAGNIVKLGEFGNFRLTICSEGVEENKEQKVKFTARNIKGARVKFTPGVILKDAVSRVKFEYDDPEEDAAPEACDKEHAI